MRPLKSLFAALIVCLIGSSSADAHPGKLDENGCHYDRSKGQYHCHRDMPPNPNINAPVKKSRENICHDQSSTNYRQLRYFAAYRSMSECVMSGGRESFGNR